MSGLGIWQSCCEGTEKWEAFLMDFQHPNLCLGEAAVNAAGPLQGELSMGPGMGS